MSERKTSVEVRWDGMDWQSKLINPEGHCIQFHYLHGVRRDDLMGAIHAGEAKYGIEIIGQRADGTFFGRA